MKTIVVLGCLLAVSACTEVSRFKSPGGDLFYADCDNPVRLQSCRAALESACPNGYDLVRPATREEGGRTIATKSGYFRCR